MDSNGFDISTIHPQKGDTIVVTYDRDKVSPTQVVNTYEWLKEQFFEYNTVLVPKGITIESRKK